MSKMHFDWHLSLLYVSICVTICAYGCSAQEGQKRALDPL